MDTGWQMTGLFTAGVIALLAVGFAVLVWAKGRPFSQGTVFRASRLSKGNHLLPTQVLVSPTSVVHYTPQWIGRYEHSIHLAHVASVKIHTGMLLSDLLIETSGGASPIRCHGHHKRDALEMKRLVETYQDEYYRSGNKPAGPADSSQTAR